MPSKAFAKISMRLVSNQSSSEITELFKKHVQNLCPKSCKIIVKEHHGGEPVIVNTNTLGYKAAYFPFKKVWGKEPVPTFDDVFANTLPAPFAPTSENIPSIAPITIPLPNDIFVILR